MLAAISLDRISTGERLGHSGRRRRGHGRHAAVGVGARCRDRGACRRARHLFGADEFPSAWRFDVAGPVNDAVDWVNEHLRTGVPVVGGTGSFSDFLVIHVLDPVRDVLVDSPWWADRRGGGHRVGQRRLAPRCLVRRLLRRDRLHAQLGAGDGHPQPGSRDRRDRVALAVPIGMWAGRSNRVQRVLRPVLDAAQVMPAFVYLVPVIFLFRVGRVPGVVAAVIYALPPCIRIVDLGLRQVPREPREAATSFGATSRQELFKVQLPMSTPAIMLGINQTVLLVLSMVVIAGLTGSGALGLETVYGLTKGEVGRGVAGGVSIVLLAITLDRITQAWGNRLRHNQGG